MTAELPGMWERADFERGKTDAEVGPSDLSVPAPQPNPSTSCDCLEPFDAPSIYDEIRYERNRAHVKHGATSMESAPPDDPTGRRYRILSEEVGEVAREFNDAEHDQHPVDLARVRKELIQVAAMAAAWADRIAP